MRFLLVAILLVTLAPPAAAWPLGDTLTVLMRPILTIPTILAAGETLDVIAIAPPEAGEWELSLLREPVAVPLEVTGAVYDGTMEFWRLEAPVPEETPLALFDLAVAASGGIADTARHAVKVIDEYKEDWYFAHVTDTHLPGHTYYSLPGWDRDTTEEADFRAVIEDLNLIDPEFVLITGDFINEGELEDHREHRVYSRAKNMLLELEMPVYLVAGNHDIGGWPSTPPEDGTARRNWWRFFGWPWLDDPLDGVRTQNYWFDYGPVRFVGLEAYINYDSWRLPVYGEVSFRSPQLDFLADAIESAPEWGRTIAFYHYDFSDQVTDPAVWGLDMALYGHIHRDGGSIHDPVPVLATEACCDNRRSYRMVRVRGKTRLGARETIRAGGSGGNLVVEFDKPNDGTAPLNEATIRSEQDQPFEFAKVRFIAPKENAPYTSDGGEIERIFDADTALVIDVRVDVGADETKRIGLEPGLYDPPPPQSPESFVLLGNSPNPFNGSTEIRFELPEPGGDVEVRLYDVKGRHLFSVARGLYSEGSHAVPWDGHAPSGVRLPSGVYFYQVRYDGTTKTGRLIYLR